MSDPNPPNILPVSDPGYGYRIIMTGFGIIGALAAMYAGSFAFGFDVSPAETVISGAIGFIGGFLAGRKA